MPTDQLILINLFLYLLGFGILIFLRDRLNVTLTSVISIALNVAGLFIAFILLKNFKGVEQFNYQWVSFSSSELAVSLLVNKLTLLMWALVQFIALLVQVFSTKYMKTDERFTLYFSYLSLFVFSMLGLVVSGNLLFMFIFWELVGFCSYLLIGFWYTKQSATNAALKAFIVNRIGDAGFLIGIGLIYFHFQTLELSNLELLISNSLPENIGLTAIGLFLFMGCVGKSAQFPLQVWLPDAMEGPTPVSALIHAATMVAAGIFLLARVDFLFTPTAGLVIALVGGITALLAAYTAIFQNDIKKALAYSTVSQLGLMVMAIGAGATHAALFHLFTHAFFKAGLFLIAGAVIHHFRHEQNMQKMGNLWKEKPFLSILFIICAASLAGLPFFSGFLSKDAVLISTWNWASAHQNASYMLIPLLGIMASLMTGYYMVRQFVLVFLPRQNAETSIVPKTSFGLFELVLLPLAMLSLWFLYGNSPFDFEHSRFSEYFTIPHQNNHWLGYAVLAGSALVMIWSYLRSKREVLELGSVTETPFWSKLGQTHFGFDKFYLQYISKPLAGSLTTDQVAHNQKGFAKALYKFDDKVIDGSLRLLTKVFKYMGELTAIADEKLVDGAVKLTYKSVANLGDRLKLIQGGRLQSYLIALFLIFTAILIILNLL